MEFQPARPYSIFSPSAEEYSKEELVPNPSRGEMTEGSKGGGTELKTSPVAYSPFRGWNQVDSDGEREDADPAFEPNSNNLPKSDKDEKSEDDGMNSWSYKHLNGDAGDQDPGYGIGEYMACSPIQCRTPDELEVPEGKVEIEVSQENVESEALEEEDESEDQYEKCLNIAVKSIHGIVETMDTEKIENEKKSKQNPFEHSSTPLETEAVFSFGSLYPIGRTMRPSSIYVPQIETNRAVENLLAVMKKMDEDKEEFK